MIFQIGSLDACLLMSITVTTTSQGWDVHQHVELRIKLTVYTKEKGVAELEMHGPTLILHDSSL